MLKTNQIINLLISHTAANLKYEARRFYISYFWWVFEPAIEIFVLYLVFGGLLGSGDPHFFSFLVVGVVVWKWLSNSTIHASRAIISYQVLINQVDIPKLILPLIVILTDTFKFIIVFLLMIIFLNFSGCKISIHYLSLFIIVFTELILLTSLTFFFAAIIPFLPDLHILLANLLHLLFFLSGIFYSTMNISGKYHFWYMLNPMVHVIKNFRSVLLDNQWPDFNSLFAVIGFSIILLIPGVLIILKNERNYPRIVLL
jgi:lipopolysaccharide transport system permease protein